MTVASREGFFDAAMRLLARDGRTGLRLAPLCRSVGVTSGSFYHHFGSWDGFVDALLDHWERTETRELATLAAARDADPAPDGRLDVLKHLALTFPHEAEAAIRAWAHGDERVATVQRRVDAERHRAVVTALETAVPEPARRERVASLAVAVLVGVQQQLRPVDVGELRVLFDEISDGVATRPEQHSRR